MREVISRLNARRVCGAALLFLLAFCGYMGTFNDVETQMVSVPVTRIQYELKDADSFKRAKADHAAERDRAIELLQGVAESSDTDEETRKEALRQIEEIAEAIEKERRISMCLDEMGYSDTACMSSTHGITLILHIENITDDERIRIIDAVCGLSDYEAGDIKIILAKK